MLDDGVDFRRKNALWAASMVMNASLNGKVAIVTGAAGVIGRAEAMALGREGACVVVHDLRGADEVANCIRDSGGKAQHLTGDVTTPDAAAELVQVALKTFGGLDLLINNVGIGRRALVQEVSDSDWDEVLAVNLSATFRLIRAAAPTFIAQRRGLIINTSSDAGTGTYGFAGYAATKEGIIGLTRGVAWELGRHGIVTLAIRPRAFDGAYAPEQKLEGFKTFERCTGLPMVGSHPWSATISPKAAEVGEVVAWLCGNAPLDLNGQVLQIGGGEIGIWSEPKLERLFHCDQAWDRDSLDAIAEKLFAGLQDKRSRLPDELWDAMTTRSIRRVDSNGA